MKGWAAVQKIERAMLDGHRSVMAEEGKVWGLVGWAFLWSFF